MSITYKTVTIGLMALIVVLLAVTVWQQKALTDSSREAICLITVYDYDTDSGEYERVVQFSDLDGLARAQADLYDCDIEGR